jgi:hypothetical protein
VRAYKTRGPAASPSFGGAIQALFLSYTQILLDFWPFVRAKEKSGSSRCHNGAFFLIINICIMPMKRQNLAQKCEYITFFLNLSRRFNRPADGGLTATINLLMAKSMRSMGRCGPWVAGGQPLYLYKCKTV